MKDGFRKGSGCFSCEECGKLTRRTPDTSGTNLCRKCLDEGELINTIADGKIPDRMPKEYLSGKNNHKKGEHSWVAHCDEKGNELFGYCECCGKIHAKEAKK